MHMCWLFKYIWKNNIKIPSIFCDYYVNDSNIILPTSRDKLKTKQNGIKTVNMVAMIAAVVCV